MFKKPAAILLMLLYLVTASGFALNLHYCFDQIASIKIDAPADALYGKALKMSKMNCCKDSRIEVKIKDAHQNSSSAAPVKICPVVLATLNYADFTAIFQNAAIVNMVYRGPPPLPDRCIYLQNRTFRI
ncbi:MAG: hypothetical protein JST19_00855 [Bacteroidetes bacterium]|nr:hypothetical protein [Bacteroidota bacterium]